MKKVLIYTDGSCLGNPGPGGWAAILILAGTDHRKEISGGISKTTNNRMEIFAVIQALKALKEPCDVEIRTDSQYVCNAFEKGWIYNWRDKNWLRKGEPIPNSDLWKELICLYFAHKIRFIWIAGHAGDTENERCDFLARTAAARDSLSEDSVK